MAREVRTEKKGTNPFVIILIFIAGAALVAAVLFTLKIVWPEVLPQLFGSPDPRLQQQNQDLQAQLNDTITKNLTITKANNLFTISLENYTTSVDGNFANATQTISIPYTCPVDLTNLTGQASAAELFNLCTGYAPLFTDWLNVTINRCFDNFDAYKDYVNQTGNTAAKASQDLSDCKSDNGKKDGTIQSLNAQVADLNTIIGKDQEREQIYLIVGSVLILIVIVLVAALMFFMHRAGAEGG